MSYFGQSPVFGDFPFQILTGNNTKVYTLTFRCSGERGLLVFINGAVQRPGTDYTAAGSALTFSDVVPSGAQIFVYGMGLPKSSMIGPEYDPMESLPMIHAAALSF